MKKFKGSMKDFLNMINHYDKSVNLPLSENYPYLGPEINLSDYEKCSISKIINSAVKKFNLNEIKTK